MDDLFVKVIGVAFVIVMLFAVFTIIKQQGINNTNPFSPNLNTSNLSNSNSSWSSGTYLLIFVPVIFIIGILIYLGRMLL